MVLRWLYVLLLLWCLTKASVDTKENEEVQKTRAEMSHPTMAPNSKFLNPHVDDDTNLQFAIAAFGNESKAPEGKKSKASEILSKLTENWAFNVSSREQKSLDDWRLIPFFNSLIKGSRIYKLKKV